MSREKQRTDWREQRRMQAWKLKEQGWTQKDIAMALGVSEGAVSQWLKRGEAGGLDALKAKAIPGRPTALSQAQREELPSLLVQGAEAHGFRGNVWTGARVAAVIERAFGVSYHEVHVRRLLKALGWSQQQPIARSIGRDEAAIERWQREDWAKLKKKP
jgi:transposase